MKVATGKTKGIHLLCGSDHYAVQKMATELAARLAPEDPLNLEVIDAQVDGVEAAVRQIRELKAAILTLPFLGGSKLVWWKNVNFLGDDALGRSATVLETLEGIVSSLQVVDGKSVTLLISVLGVDRRRSFYKQLGKLGEITACDLPDARKMSTGDLLMVIEKKLVEEGLRCPPEVMERLAVTCGWDPRALDQAIQKLVTYAGERKTVTAEEARLLVCGSQEGVIWDYCDAILRGQPRQALAELEQLLRQGDSEVGILIMLSQQIRLAALAAVLREQKLLRVVQKGNFSNAEVRPEGEAYLPRKKSGETVNLWQLGQVSQKSQGRPTQFWLQAVDKVFRLSQQMVTGVAEKGRALELLTLELAGGG